MPETGTPLLCAIRFVDHDGLAYVEVKKATFQNFLDETAAAHSCPRVTLP